MSRPISTIHPEENRLYDAVRAAEAELNQAMKLVQVATDRLNQAVDSVQIGVNGVLVQEMGRIDGQHAHGDRYYRDHVWNQGAERIKALNRAKNTLRENARDGLTDALNDLDTAQVQFEDARRAWIAYMELTRKNLPYPSQRAP